jgi:ribosomal protein S18 acetylase RimI-like enzyme
LSMSTTDLGTLKRAQGFEMRKEPQIFTRLQKQDQPIDLETLSDLEAEVQLESRQRIKKIVESVMSEAPEVEDVGYSPLEYFGIQSPSHGKKRLIIVDKDEPDAKEGERYYKTLTKYRLRTKGGRRMLKKPVLDEVIPGAPPHTVGFIDYHIDMKHDNGDPKGVYLDYLHVRGDQRGKGHARLLAQEIVNRHPTIEYLDFGKMMAPEIGHLMRWFKDKYKGKIDVIGRIWY